MPALLLDSIYKDHVTTPGHPESPARIDAIREALDSADLVRRTSRLEPREATLDELARAHDPDYVENVLRVIESGADSLAGGDVSICPHSGKVARLAAGGVIAAVDAVCAAGVGTAFCAIRPPGHHATRDRAMGFCIFNSVAIAARHAQSVHGIERIAILDWDVHHGNGTQDIFYEDGAVLFASTHQSPWYPGSGSRGESGERRGAGLTINRPLPAGSGRTAILGTFVDDILPAVRDFKPELILISAGFDSRAGDPLGGFTLADADFADLTTAVREVAQDVCAGRIVSALSRAAIRRPAWPARPRPTSRRFLRRPKRKSWVGWDSKRQ